jgi:hypothetical protein
MMRAHKNRAAATAAIARQLTQASELACCTGLVSLLGFINQQQGQQQACHHTLRRTLTLNVLVQPYKSSISSFVMVC